MNGIVDWASARARMVLAFVLFTLIAGAFSYGSLPKEGEPDIAIPILIISLPFSGISAEDSEKLLVKPIETRLSDLDGLKRMSSVAAEGYAAVILEFEFGWDKTKTLTDVRDGMNAAEAKFPAGADKYSINELNFSEFPIIVVNLTGDLPERTLLRAAEDLQSELEQLESVLEVTLTGGRDEMVEVTVDPLLLESYNVTFGEVLNVIRQNNILVAAGDIESETGGFGVKIPSSFDQAQDIFNIPVKTNGDRVITLGDLTDIRLTLEDKSGTARFNGENTLALQVVKRKGFAIIDTVEQIKDVVAETRTGWSENLQNAIQLGTSMDQSRVVGSMVRQLEGSVLTAITLVVLVVLATLGTRAALLTGFAIPASFLLCFSIMATQGFTISNMVMFGLILSVGMLVDGAIVVVEYADRRMQEGFAPMSAYTAAAKRMFWPIVSSTGTTLCAFLPMLFWPGVAGEFMKMLPLTLIFILSASLVVAVIYLPVLGGVFGGFSQFLEKLSELLRRKLDFRMRVVVLVLLLPLGFFAIYLSVGVFSGTLGAVGGGNFLRFFGLILLVLSLLALSVSFDALRSTSETAVTKNTYQRSPFGKFIQFIVANPLMPIVSIFVVMLFVGSVFAYYFKNNNGVEYFVESEPEQAILYIRARGNLSLKEKDRLLVQAEDIVLADPGVVSVFAFAGEGGLNQNTGGAQSPRDTIAQLQLELVAWEDRPKVIENWFTILGLIKVPRWVADPAFDGDLILARLEKKLKELPGIKIEILGAARGPSSNKPLHLRLTGDDLSLLEATATKVAEKFHNTLGLENIEDTRRLPGIEWRIEVDVEKAGSYGVDVATVGAMVQLVTRGIFLDTMRVENSEKEVDIRLRLPEEDRVLSTLDTLKLRTPDGLVPLSNFITRTPQHKLDQINRVNQKRYYDIKAGLDSEVINPKNNRPFDAGTKISELTAWLNESGTVPVGVNWEWTGDQEDQAESQSFLITAFIGALGLMFVILLAQFNSFYNTMLVLLAVILSTTGVLLGMLVLNQPFSIIMTGTGIVALAGIVVNNNIVLIDTYQNYERYMPRVEAIIRTAEARIRPVLLTTVTTMAGLTPMMLGLSLDFANGGSSVDSPTALWWKQLASAVVFGLGTATLLTLVFTPSMLAVRLWFGHYMNWLSDYMFYGNEAQRSKVERDRASRRKADVTISPSQVWDNTLAENQDKG